MQKAERELASRGVAVELRVQRAELAVGASEKKKKNGEQRLGKLGSNESLGKNIFWLALVGQGLGTCCSPTRKATNVFFF